MFECSITIFYIIIIITVTVGRVYLWSKHICTL